MSDKGTVLRWKRGYNPNSSSVGSHIPAFLGWVLGAGGVSVILLHLLHLARRTIGKGDGPMTPHGKDAEETREE